MRERQLVFISILALAAGGWPFGLHSLPDRGGMDPWREEQLLDPAVLAEALTGSSQTEAPLILAVNPDGMHGLPRGTRIKGAILFGRAEDGANLERLREYLKQVGKDREIVLYCGCCPFDVCPNIRPAFNLLHELQFTSHKLLDLSQNLRVDWINKGYPMNE